jgi:hypothetical protein
MQVGRERAQGRATRPPPGFPPLETPLPRRPPSKAAPRGATHPPMPLVALRAGGTGPLGGASRGPRTPARPSGRTPCALKVSNCEVIQGPASNRTRPPPLGAPHGAALGRVARPAACARPLTRNAQLRRAPAGSAVALDEVQQLVTQNASAARADARSPSLRAGSHHPEEARQRESDTSSSKSVVASTRDESPCRARRRPARGPRRRAARRATRAPSSEPDARARRAPRGTLRVDARAHHHVDVVAREAENSRRGINQPARISLREHSSPTSRTASGNYDSRASIRGGLKKVPLS